MFGIKNSVGRTEILGDQRLPCPERKKIDRQDEQLDADQDHERGGQQQKFEGEAFHGCI